MAVVNTRLKMREEYSDGSGGRCTQVDYILCRRCNVSLRGGVRADCSCALLDGGLKDDFGHQGSAW